MLVQGGDELVVLLVGHVGVHVCRTHTGRRPRRGFGALCENSDPNPDGAFYVRMLIDTGVSYGHNFRLRA